MSTLQSSGIFTRRQYQLSCIYAIQIRLIMYSRNNFDMFPKHVSVENTGKHAGLKSSMKLEENFVFF